MSRLILIVEDTASLAASLAVALEGIDGVEPVIFGNAATALRYLEQQPRNVAALISDLNLPDENGFCLILKIRAMFSRRELPAILITGEENPVCPPAHGEGTPSIILHKPFSMKEVRRVLETLL